MRSDSVATHTTELYEPDQKPEDNAEAEAEGPILLPAFGFRESAHAVDGKIAKWVQQALEKDLPESEKTLAGAKRARDALLRTKNVNGSTPEWQAEWARDNAAFQAAQKDHATLQGLIKKIKDKRLTFSVKVPHAMTLRQLGPIILETIENNKNGYELSAYVQRQCTRDQVQRWYTQMKIIHADEVQKHKKKQENAKKNGDTIPDLNDVAEKFINDDAFSTTPLPAMEEALKAMMKIPDFINVENVMQ